MRGEQVGVLHVHSAYSHDGRDSLTALRQFALERRIRFVALSDHAEDLDSTRFDEYVAECRCLSDGRVSLLPGLEFRFAGHPGLHLLALGLRDWLAPRSPADFATAARGAGASLTIMAHPLLCDYRCPSEVAERIDAIEVWNAAYNTRYLPDPRAVRMFQQLRAMRPDLVATTGLDQHDASNDRETRVAVPSNGVDPLELIRLGQFRNIGRTMTFGPAIRWGALRLGTLSVFRRTLDAADRVHDRWARSRRSS